MQKLPDLLHKKRTLPVASAVLMGGALVWTNVALAQTTNAETTAGFPVGWGWLVALAVVAIGLFLLLGRSENNPESERDSTYFDYRNQPLAGMKGGEVERTRNERIVDGEDPLHLDDDSGNDDLDDEPRRL